MNYHLINWNYNSSISVDKDTRKCISKTIYNGNSKKAFLKKVQKNFQEYQDNSNELSKIKYNQNHFECLLNENAQSKLFFDIDKIKTSLTDLTDLLNEMFNFIDDICDKKLNRNKYLVFYKKLVDADGLELSYTHSLRIINFEYKVSYTDSKKLVELLLQTGSNNELINGLDCSVYHHNRQMGLPYNSKPYSIKYTNTFFNFEPEESVNHFLIYFDFNNKNYDMSNYTEKYCISCVDNCELLRVNKEVNLEAVEVVETEKDYTDRKEYHLEQDKHSIIQVVKNCVSKKFYTKKFSKMWCKLVFYFKCLGCDDIDEFLRYSAEMSDEYSYSNNVKWYEKSVIDLNKDYSYAYSVIANVLNEVQQEYYFYTDSNAVKLELVTKWISRKTNIPYYELDDGITKYKKKDPKKLKVIRINSDIFYDYKTGNLHTRSNEYCNNYFLEQHKCNYKENGTSDYDMVLDSIDDTRFKNVIEQFKTGNIENLVIEMDWGGGKSHHIANPIVEHFCDNRFNKTVNKILERVHTDKEFVRDFYEYESMNELGRIIAFSPNNSLNKKEYQDLHSIKNNCFVSHIKIKELSAEISKLTKQLEKRRANDVEYDTINDSIILLKRLKAVYTNRLNNITSIESCWKIQTNDNSNDIKLVVLDEFNSLFGKFNETMATFNNLPNGVSKEDVFNNFINISKKSRQRLILDADIEKDKLDFYCKVVGISKVYKVKINGNIFNNTEIAEDGKSDEYKVLLCENRKHLTSEVVKSLNKNVVISTTSSKHGYYMFKLLVSSMYDKELNIIDSFKNEVIAYIFGDGLYIYDCRNPKSSIIDKKIEKLDCENFDTDSDKECVFKQILNKYEIDKQQTTKIKLLKDSFLDSYENDIIEKYKITKLVRSPTISVGISFNTRYFDVRYNYSLWGSVECYEALQMWFRERRTREREIYFCFANYLKDYNKNLHNTSNIIKRYENNYRIANTSLIKLLQSTRNVESLNQFNKWKLINEINSENCRLNYEQIFMELLNKHSFTYDENVFVLNSRLNKIDFIDETKDDSKSVELHNLLNTNILSLTRSNYHSLCMKKDENQLNNCEYIQYRKYKLFTSVLKYQNYIVNEWIDNYRLDLINNFDDLIKEYDTPNEDYLRDTKKLDILNDDDLWKRAKEYNDEIITKYIENETHYNEYKLHEYSCDFMTKYKRLKSILNIKEAEETDANNVEYMATTKLLIILLQFLDIDIERDFKKNIIKHYIVDNSKKEYLTSIKEVLNGSIIYEDMKYKFIDFINNSLLEDYNNVSNLKNHKPINIKKLNVDKNLLEIMTILKYYLTKVNLYFDYSYNCVNQSRLSKSLQFTIRKQYNITTKEYVIPHKVLYNKKLKKDSVEEYEKQIHYTNHSIINEIINNDFIQSGKKFIDYKSSLPHGGETRTENIYAEKDITVMSPLTTKTVYKDIKEEEVIEDVYGNKVIIKPVSSVKLGFGNKYFNEDKSIQLKIELYESYTVNTRTDIINYLDTVKVNKYNFSNLINKKVKAFNHNKDCVVEQSKKRRFIQEDYDNDKREKVLNFINMEIKQPVEATDIFKAKYDKVINELNYRVVPLIIKHKKDYMDNVLNKLVEAY